MRICILGSPRSGTTSLLNYISESLNIFKLNEPYNSDFPITEQSTWPKDNMAVKHLMHQLSNKQKLDLHKHFDKVVCIYRKDLKASSESWLTGYYTGNWSLPYTYAETKAIENSKLNIYSKEFIKQKRKQEIKEINQLKYFTITYEDLFYSDKDKKRLNKYLNIKSPLLEYLDTSKRLRKDSVYIL